MKEIIISANEAGQRLDKMLAKYLKEAPKSFLYKMLRKKNIVLNGKKATGNEKLSEQDSVKLFLADETISKFSGQKLTVIQSDTKLNIIYEDDDVVFINKPVGMLSQKAKENDISVVEHLTAHLIQSKSLSEEELLTFRPSICNRLDRNTSGIIVAGKSLTGLQAMSELFRQRTLRKYYRCLVVGVVKSPRKIHGYLIKDETSNTVRISKEKLKEDGKKRGVAENGSMIQTEYISLGSNGEISLLEVHLITGKTHQIRAHLASIGHPIIGDYKYGNRKVNDTYKSRFGVESQLLHSYRLEFPILTGDLNQLSEKTFIAEPPRLFQKICEEL